MYYDDVVYDDYVDEVYADDVVYETYANDVVYETYMEQVYNNDTQVLQLLYGMGCKHL